MSVSSVAQSCPTLCDPMDCSTPGLPVHHQLPELAQTHVNPVNEAIQPSHPLSSPSPPAFNLSQHQGLFQWVSSSLQVAKSCSFSFSFSPSNEYSGLISFRIDWFNLLAVQGTVKTEFIQKWIGAISSKWKVFMWDRFQIPLENICSSNSDNWMEMVRGTSLNRKWSWSLSLP